jgi:hypothetical protein
MKMDKDVTEMSPRELQREVMKLRTAFRRELAHTGNRRCWVTLLKALPEGAAIESLSLPREEFLGNCAAYFDRNQTRKRKVKLTEYWGPVL